MNTTTSLTDRPAWKALQAHYEKVKELHLRKLFADDPPRGERENESVHNFTMFISSYCRGTK